MSRHESEPPRLASWLLRHTRPRGDDGALEGDILERHREGRTDAWFWRQVLAACGFRALGGIRNHWPCFAYAFAAMAMKLLLGTTVGPVAAMLRWWTLPFPLSQLVFELSAPALLALGALPALGIGLTISGEFRWASLFRTGLTSLTFLVLGKFLFDAFSPLLLVPIPGNPYAKRVAAPEILPILSFLGFVASAWIGCRVRLEASMATRCFRSDGQG